MPESQRTSRASALFMHKTGYFSHPACRKHEMGAGHPECPERLDAIIAASQEAQRVGGHYGVPLMVFDSEPFFGQDRFDQLKWRMLQKGLVKR